MESCDLYSYSHGCLSCFLNFESKPLQYATFLYSFLFFPLKIVSWYNIKHTLFQIPSPPPPLKKHPTNHTTAYYTSFSNFFFLQLSVNTSKMCFVLLFVFCSVILPLWNSDFAKLLCKVQPFNYELFFVKEASVFLWKHRVNYYNQIRTAGWGRNAEKHHEGFLSAFLGVFLLCVFFLSESA